MGFSLPSRLPSASSRPRRVEAAQGRAAMHNAIFMSAPPASHAMMARLPAPN